MRRTVPGPRPARLLSTRRQFVHGVGGLLGGVAAGCAAPASRERTVDEGGGSGGQSGAGAGRPSGAGQAGSAGGSTGHKQAADRVTIGTTGIVVSRMAIGSGTHGTGGMSDQTRLGMTPFVSLLTYAHSQGVTFFETADQYGAHAHVGEAVRQVGRQNAVILTKTHARTAAELEADLARFRSELGVDMIDIVLLHMMVDGNWTTEYAGAMEALERAKTSGQVRAHGVSCHNFDAMQVAAASPWVDLQQARINPAGVLMDASPEQVIANLEQTKAAGKGVIGMKILGEGRLANQLDTAIAHAVGLDCLDCFTIGFTSGAQLAEVAQKIAAV